MPIALKKKKTYIIYSILYHTILLLPGISLAYLIFSLLSLLVCWYKNSGRLYPIYICCCSLSEPGAIADIYLNVF